MSPTAPIQPSADEGAPREGCFCCPAELTLGTVEAVHAAWLDAHGAACVPTTVPVPLDGRAVMTIDTAGLQLLTCLVLDLARAGRSWRWLGVSPALSRAADGLGLGTLLFAPRS